MAPRVAGKPNWNLIIAVVSMGITICTLLVAGIWALSSKNTDFGSIQAQTTENAKAIAATQQKMTDLNDGRKQALDDFQQIYIRDITRLQEQNKEILDELAELKSAKK